MSFSSPACCTGGTPEGPVPDCGPPKENMGMRLGFEAFSDPWRSRRVCGSGLGAMSTRRPFGARSA